MQLSNITKDIQIEELVENYPFAIRYLMEKKIRCIMCGEPVWGTLEDAAKEKDFTDSEIQGFCNDLNLLAEKHSDLIRKE